MSSERPTPLLLLAAVSLVLALACGGREDAEDAAEATTPAPAATPTPTPDGDGVEFGESGGKLAKLVEQRKAERRAKGLPLRGDIERIELAEGQTSIELPADYATDVPLFPDAQPTKYVSSKFTGTMTSLATDESTETARSYYVSALGEEGWAVEFEGAQGGLTMLHASKGGRMLAVAITEEAGETIVTLIESTE